jgi:hypothetical protein
VKEGDPVYSEHFNRSNWERIERLHGVLHHDHPLLSQQLAATGKELKGLNAK